MATKTKEKKTITVDRNSVLLQIHRIRQNSLIIDESAFIKDGISNIRVDFKWNADPNSNLFILDLRLVFFYISNNKTFIESEVQNTFMINDLKSYYDEKNQLDLPPQVLVTIVSLSLSHARAIISQSVSGSFYNGILIPIMDGPTVARHFFGEDIKLPKNN